jgi:hypothetical protein
MKDRRLIMIISTAALFTVFAIWFIISHAPKPGNPHELGPIGQRYYCSMRCEKTCEQCVESCTQELRLK